MLDGRGQKGEGFEIISEYVDDMVPEWRIGYFFMSFDKLSITHY